MTENKFGIELPGYLNEELVYTFDKYKIFKYVEDRFIGLRVAQQSGTDSYAMFDYERNGLYTLCEIITHSWAIKKNLASHIITTATNILNWKILIAPEDVITIEFRNFLKKMLRENKICVRNYANNNILSIKELEDMLAIDNSDYGFVLEKV